jgi:hypothetical protein
MSDWFSEQQINIIFCVKLGKNASDGCAVLSEAYGGEAMKKSSVFEWHTQFKQGHENLEDKRCGHPRSHRSHGNAEKVQNMVRSYRRLSIIAMVVQLHLDRKTVKSA